MITYIQDYFGWANIPEFKSTVPVISIGEYKKDQGEDEFSRKQVWFYIYGQEEIEQEKNQHREEIDEVEDDDYARIPWQSESIERVIKPS